MFCVIGDRSNISQSFLRCYPKTLVIGSDKIEQLNEVLESYEDINIIMNSFNKTPNLLPDQDPIEYSQRTVGLVAQLASICKGQPESVNSLIYSSSAAVYGDNPRAQETDQVLAHNLYSSTKLVCEQILNQALGETKIRVIIARLFNVYGNDDKFSVISKIQQCLVENREFFLANDGHALRDFIHVDDVVRIYRNLASTGAKGTINIGTGVSTQIKNVIQMCEAYHQAKLKIKKISNGDVQQCVASVDKLNSILGTQEFLSLEDFLNINRNSS